MDSSPSLATLHGMATVGGVACAALFLRRMSLAVYGLAYVATCDVLWRMTGAGVPWEASKHGLWVVSLIIIARFHRRLPRPLALMYFVLLLPAALITVAEEGVAGGRTDIVFNLSGPLSLAAAVSLFSVLRLDERDLRRITYLAIAPVTAIWSIAFRAVLSVEEFTTDSSKEAVGGFGPNQVSTVLGFGGLLAILWALRDRNVIHRAFLFGAGLAFLVQSMLTFSRGGLVNTIAALLVVAVVYLRRPSRVLGALAVAAVLVSVVSALFGQLDEFTGGKLGERFADADVTGRDEIASADLAVWAKEPITGVGPGRARDERPEGQRSNAAAHTEFTRLLAEHGIPGLIAILILGAIALQNLRGRPTVWELAWSAALMVWTAAALSNAAMRVAAISFAFGLASARMSRPGRSATASATPAAGADASPLVSSRGDELGNRVGHHR